MGRSPGGFRRRCSSIVLSIEYSIQQSQFRQYGQSLDLVAGESANNLGLEEEGGQPVRLQVQLVGSLLAVALLLDEPFDCCLPLADPALDDLEFGKLLELDSEFAALLEESHELSLVELPAGGPVVVIEVDRVLLVAFAAGHAIVVLHIPDVALADGHALDVEPLVARLAHQHKGCLVHQAFPADAVRVQRSRTALSLKLGGLFLVSNHYHFLGGGENGSRAYLLLLFGVAEVEHILTIGEGYNLAVVVVGVLPPNAFGWHVNRGIQRLWRVHREDRQAHREADCRQLRFAGRRWGLVYWKGLCFPLSGAPAGVVLGRSVR